MKTYVVSISHTISTTFYGSGNSVAYVVILTCLNTSVTWITNTLTSALIFLFLISILNMSDYMLAIFLLPISTQLIETLYRCLNV